MEIAPDLLEKEKSVAVRIRQALSEAEQAAMACGEPNILAPHLAGLLEEYEALAQRSRRVAELARCVQQDLDDALEQVTQLTQVDGLTGAMNRPSFERLLSRDWAQAQRESTPLSLLLVNVDSLQAYNVLYGSLAGDECLRAVARALMRCLYREVDVVARLEGDTFAALLPGTVAEGAAVVGQRILEEVAGMEIPHLESVHGGFVSVSVGLSTMTPGRGDAPLALVRAAQAALGAAKDGGRACLALA